MAVYSVSPRDSHGGGLKGDSDDGQDSGSNRPPEERRREPRVLVDLEVDYGNEDNFLFAYIRDISTTGIFVRTNEPEPQGTRLNLRFSPRETEGALELEGEVIWINPYRPDRRDNLHPGMGIRFLDLTEDQRRGLVEYIKTFAYLAGDDDDDPPAGDQTVDDPDRS